jgi:hypothetical protein
MNTREHGARELIHLTPAILVVERIKPDAEWMRKLPDDAYGVVYHQGHLTVTQEWATFIQFAHKETKEATMAHFYDIEHDYVVHVRDVRPGIVRRSDSSREVVTGLLPEANVDDANLHRVIERRAPLTIETVQKPWTVYTQLLGEEGRVYRADTMQFVYALELLIK